MIQVKIFNGLGNQMFQYACARAVQEKYGGELYLDISDFKTNKRKYGLHNFKLNENIKYIEEDKTFWNLRKNIGLKSCCKLMPNLVFNLFKNKGKYLYLGEEYKQINNNVYNDYYLYGYWQSEKYFEPIKQNIMKEFELKDEMQEQDKKIIEKMQKEKSVAIHIRRGDYVSGRLYKDICNLQYYNNAIKLIKNRVRNPSFFVFSDDIEWAKENLRHEPNMKFMEESRKDYEELILMSNCKNYIIANSSFSWWGQYLCKYPQKQVVAPKKWYNNNKKVDIYMKNWIKI